MKVVIISCILRTLGIASNIEDNYKGFRIPYDGWTCPEIFELPKSRQSFYDDYIYKRQPVIIRDAVALLKWKGQPKDWNDEFLCTTAGDADVSVVVRKTVNHRSSGVRKTMRLCDFIKEKDPLKYITQFQGSRDETAPLSPWMTAFTPYFTVPYFYDYTFSTVNMWLGYPVDPFHGELAKASTTNAHFDGPDNLFTVLAGQKTFHLWDPSSARGLYTYAPVKSISPSGDMTMGEPPNPDLPEGYTNPFTLQRPKTSQVPMHLQNASSDLMVKKLFPMFGRATRKGVCIVNPGDMIYFPGTFFHEVISKGRHLGINFWLRRERKSGRGIESGVMPPRGSHSRQSGLEVSSDPY